MADSRVKAYPITAMGKPRMTRADKFKKREVVLRYRAFNDECRIRRLQIPESCYHLVFVLPVPKSWSKNKKAEMYGQPLKGKSDKDNLEKSHLMPCMTMMPPSGMAESPSTGAMKE